MSNEGRARSAALPEGAMLMGGKYRIVKKLGQGGFGITYLAEHVVLRKRVAIKEFFFQQFCARDTATSHVTVPLDDNRELVDKFRRKFVKEAQLIAGKLSHPSIVRVSDVFDENGTSYYVMDYIEGRSLSEIVAEQGRMGETEAIAIIDAVGRALDFIHSQNINHLDIKPGNIMVERNSGNVVLIDFGVAKQYDATTGEATTTTPVAHSRGYAPPEQYKAGGVGSFSPESDIYALGATLYKMVTGNTPPDAMDVVAQGGIPPLPGSISAHVRRAITAAMQTAKNARPHTVAEFLDMLHGKSAGGDETEVDEKKQDDKVEAILIDDGKGGNGNNGDNGDSGGIASDSSASGHISQPQPQPAPQSHRRKWLPWAVAAGVAAVVFAAIMLLRPKHDEPQIPTEQLVAVLTGDTVSPSQQQAQPQQPSQSAQQEQPQPQQQPSQPQQQQPTQQQTQQTQPVQQQPVQPEPQRQQSNLPEIEMVWVSGGTFTMGATSEQGSDAWDDEKPSHSVTLDGYYIGKYEVTQKLWKAVMGNNPSYFKGDNLPVENVSWNDVQDFISKLNRMTGKSYRLPTEAEWEYAARGGNKSRGYKYSGSDNIGSVAWYSDNSGNTTNTSNITHPVGSKSPNELGIYDMSGNVYEWCQDWYSSGYYSNSPQSNPKGPTSGSHRVIRGGGWNGNARSCRVSYRSYISPDNRYDNLGFRLAL